MSEQATLPAKLWSGVSRKKLHFPFEVVQKYGMLPMDQFCGLEGEKTSLEPFFFFFQTSVQESLLEGILCFQK